MVLMIRVLARAGAVRTNQRFTGIDAVEMRAQSIHLQCNACTADSAGRPLHSQHAWRTAGCKPSTWSITALSLHAAIPEDVAVLR